MKNLLEMEELNQLVYTTLLTLLINSWKSWKSRTTVLTIWSQIILDFQPSNSMLVDKSDVGSFCSFYPVTLHHQPWSWRVSVSQMSSSTPIRTKLDWVSNGEKCVFFLSTLPAEMCDFILRNEHTINRAHCREMALKNNN